MNTSALTLFAQHLFIASSALLLAGFILHRLLHRRPAAVRELLWRTVFTVLIVLPLVWFLKPLGMIRETAAETRLARIDYFLGTELAQASQPSTMESQSTSVPESGLSVATVLFSFWAAGSLLLLARAAGGTLLRRRWLAQARECSGTRVQTIWRALPGPSGARLLVSAACPVPLTWGRTVILPEDALTWSDEHLRSALQHEAAHMRRRDSFFRRMGEFAAALLWPQLLLWPARRLWHRMQEQACDDAVIREGTEAASYAELLCQAARAWNREVPGALAMAQPSSLEKRIRAVMNPHGDRRLCSRGNVAAALVAGCLTFTCAALAQKPEAPAKPARPPAAGSTAKAKAMKIVIPRIQFAEATLGDVIAYVKAKSKELDPDQKGLTIKGPPGKVEKTITVDLRNVLAWELLAIAAEMTDTHLEAGPDAIVFKPGAAEQPPAPPASPIEEKAKKIRIGKLIFERATVDEMVSYVRRKAAEEDATGSDRNKKGLNIVVKNAGTATASLSLTDVSVWDCLNKIAEAAGMDAPRVTGESILLDRPKK